MMRIKRGPCMLQARKKIFLFFITCAITCVSAQEPALRFKHIATEHGLSASAVTCIIKDRDGYMWFGTYDGLNKFDGYEFQVYRNASNAPGSISSNAVLAMYEDRKGRLWLGTQTGLDIFDRATDSFAHLRNASGVTLTVVDIEETAAGEILFLASDHILSARLEDSTCVLYQPDKLLPYLRPYSGLRRLMLDREGLLWVIMEANGLVAFDRHS